MNISETVKVSKDILILGIESSCDETAASVVRNGREVLSNIISSQIDIHTLYGGVVPEIASRKHMERIDQVVMKAIADAGVTMEDIDAIAVTYGPGLVGALLVGVSYAKSYAWALDKPLVGVHHIEGHICANYIENPDLKPPFMCLVVSGGHTHLVRVKDYGDYEILGRTRDDAAGEAFDKVARVIGLGYPGGPKIDKVSYEGDPAAIDFPRAKIADNEYDFSFSGLKSAVLNYLNSLSMKGENYDQADVAASFQQAVVDVLTGHSMAAIKEYGTDSFAIAGGVASNSHLREAMKKACDELGVKFYMPSPIFCTDNAAMIAVAGYHEYMAGNTADWNLNAVPALKLGER
ncbi:MAG: tRNA (adenosine(37)-N6)-threonylcarbamoyltransferase complex transferase subunit TsaD [Lachnospiraceae bacterium]|nr:tRNA (adenosine(37)-N6)-threonylcarbamoyltransferase complex transferase subunit TsaD [Lachnospiraceae bacterium]